MNKRKRVALYKHRRQKKRLELKRKAVPQPEK